MSGDFRSRKTHRETTRKVPIALDPIFSVVGFERCCGVRPDEAMRLKRAVDFPDIRGVGIVHLIDAPHESDKYLRDVFTKQSPHPARFTTIFTMRFRVT